MSKNSVILVGAIFLLIGFSSLQAEPPSLTTGKSADPAVIYLPGEGSPDEATVTLTVTGIGDPQIQTFPIDVVLVMDRSASMAGQTMNDAKVAAMYFCKLLDGELDQSSLVSFGTTATLDQELTPDHYLTIVAINGLEAGGNTAIGSGIYEAHTELTSSRHRPEAQPVMVLMSDGNHNAGPDPLAAADLAKSHGTIIYAIGLGAQVNEQLLMAIASDPDSEYYYYAPSSEDLDSIYGTVHEHISHLAAREVFAFEILAESIHYVPGSFSIDPIWVVGDSAAWELGALNIGDTWSVSFNITASDTGYLPVDDYPVAQATYLNFLGDPDSVPFPQAYVRVLPLTGVEEDLEKQGRAAFLRVRPNPFSSFSAIQYTLTRPAPVTLEIYNLAGELIRTLAAGLKPAGTYIVAWDTKDDSRIEVPAGVYLLRLKAGNSASTHKIVLLR